MNEYDEDQRKEMVNGLRALADFLESTPEYVGDPILTINTFVHTKNELTQIARVLGSAQKEVSGNYFSLCRRFSKNVRIEVNASRDKVCEAVITQKVEPATPEQIIPEKVIPAKPERVVEHIDWVCPPSILAEAHS